MEATRNRVKIRNWNAIFQFLNKKNAEKKEKKT